jgi:GT2 family glycosyltransferase
MSGTFERSPAETSEKEAVADDVSVHHLRAAIAANASFPSVVIVVLNWNGRDDTIACIESLDDVDYDNFQIIVVDNGSVDGSVEAVRARFPDLQVVETGRNLGFAEGNNVGIRLALERGADYVFLLNNDTVVHHSLVTELVSAAERCSDGGIFTAKIFYHAEPTRIWSAGVRWNEDRMEFQHLQDETEHVFDSRGVVATDYACGCALFARATVLREIGLLDPKFFLTFEETDLCYRARRVGILCYYVPSAMLWHKISVSFGGAESPLVKYFIARNRLLWGERHLKLGQLLQLYKRTWWDLNHRFLPRSAAPTSGGVLRKWRGLASCVAERWKDPANRAVALGALHYLLRRFGDAPKHVRMLGRTETGP